MYLLFVSFYYLYSPTLSFYIFKTLVIKSVAMTNIVNPVMYFVHSTPLFSLRCLFSNYNSGTWSSPLDLGYTKMPYSLRPCPEIWACTRPLRANTPCAVNTAHGETSQLAVFTHPCSCARSYELFKIVISLIRLPHFTHVR